MSRQRTYWTGLCFKRIKTELIFFKLLCLSLDHQFPKYANSSVLQSLVFCCSCFAKCFSSDLTFRLSIQNIPFFGPRLSIKHFYASGVICDFSSFFMCWHGEKLLAAEKFYLRRDSNFSPTVSAINAISWFIKHFFHSLWIEFSIIKAHFSTKTNIFSVSPCADS